MEDPDHRAAIDRAKARAATLDEAGIDRLVRAATLPERKDDDYWTLVILEERAVPAIVRALSDPEFHAITSPLDSDFKSAERLESLWDFLEDHAPESAVGPLAKLVVHPEGPVRKEAGFALGTIGKAACIEPLRVALRSKEHDERTHALLGIGHALVDRRAEPAFLAGIFDDVARIVDLDSVGPSDAPRTLTAIDRGRATKFLLSPERFNAKHGEIGSICHALADARVVAPPDRVIAVLDELEKESDRSSAYGYGLQLLALTHHPSAADRIERAMRFENRDTLDDIDNGEFDRQLAADALLLLHGIGDAYQVAISAWGGPGKLDRLPEPIRNYATVHVLNNEITNGGLQQYFFNSYGEDVHAAVAGLEAIGAKKSAKIVRKAISLFGKAGPSPDREKRWEQLESIADGAFEPLEEAYYKDPDHLHVLLARYAVAHKELFTKK